MAWYSTCASCGKSALTVRREGQRWCLTCTAAVEFTPGPGRKIRAYMQKRILKDDRADDRAALFARLLNGKGWLLAPPWLE